MIGDLHARVNAHVISECGMVRTVAYTININNSERIVLIAAINQAPHLQNSRATVKTDVSTLKEHIFHS